MLRSGLLSWLLAAALVMPTVPLRAEGPDPLTEMQAERQKLEREAAQYRASIDLLTASGTSHDSPAVTSLVRELGMVRRALNELDAREAAFTPAPAAPMAKDPDSSDAARLAAMLKKHYAAEEAANKVPEKDAQPEYDLAGISVDTDKVRLSGHEGVATIMTMSQRLSSLGVAAMDRDTDIVFSIEMRQDGHLISKNSYSLQALGMSQYIGKVSLSDGDARITVRSQRWNVELDGRGDYLVTLYAPGGDEPQLHLIPVEELKATQWNNPPDWLPPMEAEAPSRS